MKYSAIIIALAVGVFALPQDQEGSTITSAPSSSTTSASVSVQASCLADCDPADVTCQAECMGVARPNASQVIETNECAAKCDQGDGSPSDTQKFADCQQDCYAKYYPSSQTLDPVAGPASNAAATGTASGESDAPSGTANGTGAKPTGSGNANETGSVPANATGAASLNSVQLTGAGLAGLALAVFGL